MSTEIKKKNKSKFWFGFRIYVGAIVVIMAVMLIIVWSKMKKYEESQPQYLLEDIIEGLEKGDTSSINFSSESKFEDAGEQAKLLAESVKGKELTYSIKTSSLDKMEYNINDGDTTVAVVSINASNTRKMMAILSISDWKIGTVMAPNSTGNNNVKVTVPESFIVSVNGVELGEDEKSGDSSQVEGMEYAAEFVDVPTMITYEVKGLINKPEVTVKDNNGNDVDLSSYKDYSDVSLTFAAQEMPQELQDYVITAAKSYSNFFSKDLDGCSAGTGCIEPYFTSGSEYIARAEEYRLHDMWMYSAHSAPVFSDVAVSDYVVYSDNFFSCRVTFNKDMTLTANGQTMSDPSDKTYYYVKVNDSWVIAYMIG